MNTPTRIEHLTEDEVDELLITGPEDHAALQRHVASCDACQQRLAEFSTSLAAFNDATRRWSEARSNTLNRDLSPALAESRMWTRRVQWLGPLTAAVLVAAVMMATPGSTSSLNPEHAPATTETAAVSAPAVARMPATPQPALKPVTRPAPAETAALAVPATRSSDAAAAETHHAHDTKEIASDNAILFAIDSAIDPQEPTPDEFYRSTGGAAGPLNQAVASQVTD